MVAPRINFEAHQQRSTFHEFQTFLRPNHETAPFAVLHSILSSKSFSKHLLYTTHKTFPPPHNLGTRK